MISMGFVWFLDVFIFYSVIDFSWLIPPCPACKYPVDLNVEIPFIQKQKNDCSVTETLLFWVLFLFLFVFFPHNFSCSCNQWRMEVFCVDYFRVGRDSFPIRPTLSSEQVPSHDWAFACMEIAVLPVPLWDSSIISGVCIWAVVELAVSLPEAGSCAVCAIPLLPSLILQLPVSLHRGETMPLCTAFLHEPQ